MIPATKYPSEPNYYEAKYKSRHLYVQPLYSSLSKDILERLTVRLKQKFSGVYAKIIFMEEPKELVIKKWVKKKKKIFTKLSNSQRNRMKEQFPSQSFRDIEMLDIQYKPTFYWLKNNTAPECGRLDDIMYVTDTLLSPVLWSEVPKGSLIDGFSHTQGYFIEDLFVDENQYQSSFSIISTLFCRQDKETFLGNLEKIAMHELGHIQFLDHHTSINSDGKSCPMKLTDTLMIGQYPSDIWSSEYCPQCKEYLKNFGNQIIPQFSGSLITKQIFSRPQTFI